MIKNLYKILFFTVVSTAFTGCLKKGDDDPFISLQTRKARICGEWKLVSGEISFKYSDTTEIFTYAGSKMKYKLNGVFVGDYTFHETMIINKKGSYGITRGSSDLYSYEGYWYFGNKNEKLEIKNKETVIFARKNLTSPTQTYNWNGLNAVNTYYIERLSERTLVIKMDYDYYASDTEKKEISEYWKYEKQPVKK